MRTAVVAVTSLAIFVLAGAACIGPETGPAITQAGEVVGVVFPPLGTLIKALGGVISAATMAYQAGKNVKTKVSEDGLKGLITGLSIGSTSDSNG